MYRGCSVALPLSYFYWQRLLCGLASTLCSAVAVWHCPYPICSACGVVLLLRILCTAVAVWHRPLGYLQRLLCGLACILCIAVDVWHCPILFAALAVVLLLSYVHWLLCGVAPILFAALAV